jgi:hypothetical protein
MGLPDVIEAPAPGDRSAIVFARSAPDLPWKPRQGRLDP